MHLKYAESLYDHTYRACVRLKALCMKHDNSAQPTLIMHHTQLTLSITLPRARDTLVHSISLNPFSPPPPPPPLSSISHFPHFPLPLPLTHSALSIPHSPVSLPPPPPISPPSRISHSPISPPSLSLPPLYLSLPLPPPPPPPPVSLIHPVSLIPHSFLFLTPSFLFLTPLSPIYLSAPPPPPPPRISLSPKH